jgi:hypothetical protein
LIRQFTNFSDTNTEAICIKLLVNIYLPKV